MTLEELKVLITAETAGLKKELAGVKKQFGSLNQAVEKSTAGMKKSFNGVKVAVAAAAATMAVAIGAMVKSSIQSASELESAMLGLQSILEAQGRSFTKANRFIQEYISDGLVPLTDAVTAYKNLTARGYNDEQIQQVMSRLKDSAAFGRQASYTLGQAVKSATEGLKNENSILVDNAGVTKNVAKMWDEYARSIGKNAQQLTQQEKIQAEVNGILKETQFQVGDAAKYADTFAGRLAALSKILNDIKVNIGNAFMPIINTVLPILQKLGNSIAQVTARIAQFMQAVFGKTNIGKVTIGGQTEAINDQTAAVEELGDATAAAGKKAKGALAGFDELNTLSTGSAGGSGGSGGGASVESPLVDVSGAEEEAVAGMGDEFEKLRAKMQPAIEAFERLKLAMQPVKEFAAQGLRDFYDRVLVPIGEWVMGTGLPRFIDAITNGLQNVNWDGLRGALNDLWAALTPFAIHVGEGLLWFWENVLVPLGVWTVSEVAPAFLQALAGAISVLNAVIEALKPLGQWLWDNFLKPLASWTGGVIVGVLVAMGDALKGLGGWIQNNTGAVQALFAIFATWKSTTFVVEMIKATAAIIAHTTATIQSKVETLYLTGLYAKDAIVRGLSATATWLQVAATTAWNVVAAIAAGVTTALGAAMAFLTSPIGLVVLAIAALIAIGVLLYKNWDEIVAWAKDTWKKVVGFFQNLYDDLVGHSIIPDLVNDIMEWINKLPNFFAGIWNDIKNAASTAWNSVKDTAGTVWNNIKTAITNPVNAAKNTITGYINDIKSAFANMKITIPNPKLPHITWSSGGSSATGALRKALELLNLPTSLPKLNVNWYAQGGIFNGPSVIGVGEAGTEAVVPLDKLPTLLADALRQVLGSSPALAGAGGDIYVYVGNEQVEAYIHRSQDRRNSRSNGR